LSKELEGPAEGPILLAWSCRLWVLESDASHRHKAGSRRALKARQPALGFSTASDVGFRQAGTASSHRDA
jgi:hypothetical protein